MKEGESTHGNIWPINVVLMILLEVDHTLPELLGLHPGFLRGWGGPSPSYWFYGHYFTDEETEAKRLTCSRIALLFGGRARNIRISIRSISAWTGQRQCPPHLSESKIEGGGTGLEYDPEELFRKAKNNLPCLCPRGLIPTLTSSPSPLFTVTPHHREDICKLLGCSQDAPLSQAPNPSIPKFVPMPKLVPFGPWHLCKCCYWNFPLPQEWNLNHCARSGSTVSSALSQAEFP